MIILLSPSKTLNFKSQTIINEYSMPQFLTLSERLITTLGKLSTKQIADLMDISPTLVESTSEKITNWSIPFTPENAKQAILSFKGEVYRGLQAESFSEVDFEYAQKHLRILSGLYGILRPLDLIQPYRLEMGIKLKTISSENIYQFWGNKITNALNNSLLSIKATTVINLASVEYFKVINMKLLKAKVITIEFREFKNGEYKVIAIFAKKARGLMSRFIIQYKITDLEHIKAFDDDGYLYNERLSNHETWVFTRDRN